MALLNSYEPKSWQTGEQISNSGLNHMESGIKAATDGVKSLQQATVKVNILEAGSSGSATFDGSNWTFNLPKGDQGLQGPQGQKGDTGAQGAQGLQGVKGDAGQKGDKGDTGEQGPKGDKGETGASGANGKNGTSIRIAVSAVTESSQNPLSDLHPSDNAAVNDIVLDATNNKLYLITEVGSGNYTVGNSIATLASLA